MKLKTIIYNFTFVLADMLVFNTIMGHIVFLLEKGNSILLYNLLNNESSVNAILDINTKLVSVLVKIEKLHGLFSEDAAETIPFLSDEHK